MKTSNPTSKMKSKNPHSNIYKMGNGYLVKFGSANGIYFGPGDYSDPLQAALMARELMREELGLPVA